MRVIWVPLDWTRPRRLVVFHAATSIREASHLYRPFGSRTKIFRQVSRKKWKPVDSTDTVPDEEAVICILEVPTAKDNRGLLYVSFDVWDPTQSVQLPILRLVPVDLTSNDTVMHHIQKRITQSWDAFYSAEPPENTLFGYPFRIRNQKTDLSNPSPLWNMGSFCVCAGRIEWNAAILPEESFYRRRRYSGSDMLSFTTSYWPLLHALQNCIVYSRDNEALRVLIACELKYRRSSHPLLAFLQANPGLQKFLLSKIFFLALPRFAYKKKKF